MTDVLDTLSVYPDGASIMMSKRVVNDVVDEIARLRAEKDAVRAELANALALAAQHLDCFRTERWELGNVMRERDALRAACEEAETVMSWMLLEGVDEVIHETCPQEYERFVFAHARLAALKGDDRD